MSNRLINETSPYLLQHANNPVDWYPWGKEALLRAESEDKPIFLSIGYSACHWCHVMERESFEDQTIATILNNNFISIKVDRELNPDLDQIYMGAVIAMTGQGGWPMSVFLTPQLKPFYGGTYFPPTPRHNLPAFSDVLNLIVQKWKKNRKDIFTVSERLSDRLIGSEIRLSDQSVLSDSALITQAINSIQNQYDEESKGWGYAPKFPMPSVIDLLLVQSAYGDHTSTAIVKDVLWAMISGGFHDLLGGGFHRYSTDPDWLIPHFEKMLYDNAQLANTYLYGYLITSEEQFRTTCESTVDFILRDMQNPLGGFYSSMDADSEGVEGKFFQWEFAELESLLSNEEFLVLCDVCNILPEGNFNGKIILRHTKSYIDEINNPDGRKSQRHLAWTEVKSKLLNLRRKRKPPETDTKVLTSWNALTLTALANAGRYLKRTDYLDAAQKLAHFLVSRMKVGPILCRS